MNFGTWIIISFILFASFMAVLVTICLRQEVNLVSKDYYHEELEFQQQILRERNTSLLESKPSIDVRGRILTLILNQPSPIDEGSVKLFCPANPDMDRTFSIEPKSKSQTFDLNELTAGMYRVKVRWSMDSRQYYQEKVINL